MNNSNLEILKELFSNSSERVFLTDCDFNILWTNDCESEPSGNITDMKNLFSEYDLPLKSGHYQISLGGRRLDCQIINYSKYGVYVLQFNRNDTLDCFIQNETIQKFLLNSTGTIRQAISGITVSANILSQANLDLQTVKEHFEIITGNCLKILKPVMNLNELSRYSDGSIEKADTDASAILKKLCEICRSILDQKVTIKTKIKKDLFICTDPERFIMCMLSAIVIANGGSKINNIISLTAEMNDGVVITIASDRKGKVVQEKVFSAAETLYSDDEINLDMLIIRRFCAEFGGTFEISEDNGKKAVRIVLPFSECDEAVCNSSAFSYPFDQFSKYNAAFVDILY